MMDFIGRTITVVAVSAGWVTFVNYFHPTSYDSASVVAGGAFVWGWFVIHGLVWRIKL